ncbi:sensor histidine kinase [Pseudonocardia endophytica]|uniref:Histidine kinase n=1 Tax=Pseudonocardia endophytica TaxID=401976 RepID=A0A4R1HWT5_PSEEN|nr:histidine kinase [Pseudonocardia endophytica]TCK26818.1 histidine kinase [Pseudonocardia endophytica]
MRTVNGSVAAQPGVSPAWTQAATAGAVRHGQLECSPLPSLRRASGKRGDDTEIRRRVDAERQTLAGALHDEIGPLLFAIAASTQRAQALYREDVGELCRTVDDVANRVHAASDRLRELLAAAAPVDADDAVPTAVERDVADFRRRTGLCAHLVVRGRARRLDARVERTVLNCLRQALFNIERHADADQVVVTLDFAPEEISLVVLDDGRGPEEFEALAGVPSGARRWGFASMSRQAEQNGGSVGLRREDGGTALRLRLPC